MSEPRTVPKDSKGINIKVSLSIFTHSVDQLFTMNPKLTCSQQNKICSELGYFRLKLLYKASIHGFTSAAFHQQCDNYCPTVSVAYNTSDYVFGGYTTQPFSQSGQYVSDQDAFLFTFSGENLIKYPVTSPDYAVRMISNCGPYYGEALVLLNENQAVVHSSPGNYYNFNAAQMHGNNLTLIDCEVYQVETRLDLDHPWRNIIWDSQKREELMDNIRNYKPTIKSVSKAKILLTGSVGAGKSSFFNSVNSVFRGHVTNQAVSGCSTTSLTTQFRTYSIKAGRDGGTLPIVLCDTMGLEEGPKAGLDINDITSILKGHMPDGHQFNPIAALSDTASGCQISSELKDNIHCVVYVIDACKISIMSKNLQEKLDTIRGKVHFMRVPQLVLVTKIDEACPLVKQDVRGVYESIYIKEMMQKAGDLLGLPLSCVVPVRNYSEELDLDMHCDILLLSAVTQMLRFVDNYFDDVSTLLENAAITE